MRSIEDKGCYITGPPPPLEISTSSCISFEFHKGNNNGTNLSSHQKQRTALGKPTPSKWDDAQKWLVGMSRGRDRSQGKTKPRNSNADDRRLIAPVPQKEQEFSSSEEEEELERQLEDGCHAETKKVDCEDDSIWRVAKPEENLGVRSICVRDMGTEMTPIASQEPSRTATPIRATTPAARSPISSGPSTPRYGLQAAAAEGRTYQASKCCADESIINDKKMNPLETRALAWDEAERAKYMARFKREEVKIEAWENHEKRKAEMEMKKIEVKADRIKARAQEKLSNKIAATRRIADEKRANAEASLNERNVRTSERADYIRRTGHLPSSFSFKLPSLCW